MKIINMPSFGADMAVGKITEWKVNEGDTVARGDIIATIETMKGLIDMEVFDNGTITTLLVKQGEEVQIGVPIAELNLSNESQIVGPKAERAGPNNIDAAADIDSEHEYSKEADTVNVIDKADIAEPFSIATKKVTPPFSALPPTSLKISPVALAKAQEQNIDWKHLKPSGEKNSPILLADILRLAGDATKGKVPDHEHKQKDKAAFMRRAIAAVVSRSKQEIPHYYLQQDICLDKAQSCLRQYNQGTALTDRILINALLYCAIAKALASFTQFNGFYINDVYKAQDSVHLGNVINLRKGGLMVAAIHNAHTLNAAQMMDKMKDQVFRAKEGGLRMSEVQDSTVTVSNLGERGVDSIQSIIFPPQVAIIGLGRIRLSPWVIDEKLVSANIVTLTLAADHRISDGHSGARLLKKIDALLQKPKALI
jgi:pyruvate dehydrogenase E2 component (dihydrolipoamide acetyltransferase)